LQRLKAHKYFEYSIDPQGKLEWSRRTNLIEAETVRDGLYLLSTNATVQENSERRCAQSLQEPPGSGGLRFAI